MDAPKEIAHTLDKALPFVETLDLFKPQTEKQQKALNNIRGLINLVEKYLAVPPKPIMFALHWKPWTWKTHLLKWFLNEIASKNIHYDFLYNPESLWSPSITLRPRSSQILAVDDLFANKQSIDKLDTYDYQALESVIFDIYSNRKIFIFTSNFSLWDLVEFINKYDKQWRLSSRIAEFVWICPDMEIDGEDYRKKVWEETKDVFWEFFS